VIPFAGGALDPSRWSVFENVACLESVSSSNDLARAIIEMYFQEEQRLPTSLFVAESQPGARGRKGRWSAPAGRGLYFTLVKKVEDSEPISVIPIAVARWTREALAQATGVETELKWPNDLYVGRRKIAGVLSEARTQGDETYVAVGIGINVLGSAADVGVPNATTLEEESGRATALPALLQAVVDRIDRELSEPRWEEEVRAWERASLHRPGDRLTVRRDDEEVRGEYLGLDRSGFLRLQTSSGEKVVPAGELAEW
jgi:BirA family transcriptional regulator, biotin operon repressor / biotin---[acetyl-CoA-carboxylase] ligase